VQISDRVRVLWGLINMIFRQLFDKATSTYTYLLADKQTQKAILIDGVIEQVERDLKLLNELNLKLVYALDTHVHADHITSSGYLRDKTGCKIGLSIHSQVDCADIQLKHDDVLVFGHQQLRILETPGHTHSCLSFLCGSRVFTGDALMIRACGRTDFQQGNADTLYTSVTKKLWLLPDDTQVYPAHDYKGMSSSTIGEEKQHNPRLILNRDAFIQHMEHLNLLQPKRIHEAVPANMRCGRIES